MTEHLRLGAEAQLVHTLANDEILIAEGTDGIQAISTWSLTNDADPSPTTPQIAALQAALAKHRPTTPHLYLAAMAVLPQHRNQGLGTALLRHRLATTSLPTYLEASTPQAAALYARHDFHPLPQIALPQGPTLHPMLRPA